MPTRQSKVTRRAASWLTAGALAGALVAIALVVDLVASRRAPARPAADGCFAFGVEAPRQVGTVVQFGVVARNVTRRACWGPSCGGITPSFEVLDLLGRIVYRASAVGVACVANPPPPPIVAPGASIIWVTETWDADTARGTYRVAWHHESGTTVDSPWFEIT